MESEETFLVPVPCFLLFLPAYCVVLALLSHLLTPVTVCRVFLLEDLLLPCYGKLLYAIHVVG